MRDKYWCPICGNTMFACVEDDQVIFTCDRCGETITVDMMDDGHEAELKAQDHSR